MTEPEIHDEGRQNLARWLRHARNGRSRREIAQLSGVAEPTIARYESGHHEFHNVPTKLRRLASFYRWTPDSVTECLRGGEPTVIPDVPPIPALSDEDRAALIRVVGASDLPARRRDELLRVLLEGTPGGIPHPEHDDVSPTKAAPCRQREPKKPRRLRRPLTRELPEGT